MSDSLLSLIGYLIVGAGLFLMFFGFSLSFIFKDWSIRKRVAYRIFIACVLLAGLGIVKFASYDWSIAGCMDSGGNLIKENPRCRFP